MSGGIRVRRAAASSFAADGSSRSTVEVARDVIERVRQSDARLTVVFASPRLDLAVLGRELGAALPGRVVGCTTAGELGPGGFAAGSVVAMSLAGDLEVGIGLVRGVRAAAMTGTVAAVKQAAATFEVPVDLAEPGDVVGMLLVDGMSGLEEVVAAAFGATAPGISYVGGSAGDDERWQTPMVLLDGEVVPDAALVVLFRLGAPHVLIKSEHLQLTDVRLVVTKVDASGRAVSELNGRPARAVYAAALGKDPATFTLADWSRAPMAVQIDGVPYIRTVRSIEGDSVHFACAVDDGLVLTVTRPGDLLRQTERALQEARERLGAGGDEVAGIAFNCLARFYEARAEGISDSLGALYAGAGLVGFNSYGEQYCSMHMNHTLTALLFAATEVA